jgi:hypothetical protein
MRAGLLRDRVDAPRVEPQKLADAIACAQLVVVRRRLEERGLTGLQLHVAGLIRYGPPAPLLHRLLMEIDGSARFRS